MKVFFTPQRFLAGKICLEWVMGILLVLLIGCEPEESVPKFPSVKTLGVEVKQGGGAIFSGEIFLHEGIAEHGFVIAEDTTFSIPYATTSIHMDRPIKSGYYEFNMATGLKKDQVYFFKAYINANNTLHYGETLSFHSNGSKAPEIEKVLPEKGYLEQPVYIYGKNFGQGNSYTMVSIGNHKIYPTSVTDTLMSFIVPAQLTTDQFTIKVTIFEKSDEVNYSLHTPELAGFEPASGTFRDIITIYGNHFDTVPERNQVFLGDEKALVIESSRNEIKVVVPDYLQMSQSPIKLYSQLQEVIAQEPFSLLAPVISEVPACISSASQVEIKGDFFNPIYSQNKVYFGETEALVVNADRNRLLVTVPFGPFPKGKSTVNLSVADLKVVDEREICMEDPWIMISNSLPFSYYRDVGTFSFSDKAYVISTPRIYDDREKYIWEFEPLEESWERFELPFEVSHTGTCTNNDLKGYVYTATENNNFWEFDPDTGQWQERAAFPGSRRDHSTIFSIDRFVFLGIGNHLNTGEPRIFSDFYRYDPALNQWTRIKDLNLDQYNGRYKVGALVLGKAAYLSGGASTTGHNDMWKYELGSNTWERKADAPSHVSYASYFSLNHKGYICNGSGALDGECWEYDSISDSFNPFYRNGHYGRYGGFAFVVKGKAYVGGGSSSSYHPNSNNELYRLNR